MVRYSRLKPLIQYGKFPLKLFGGLLVLRIIDLVLIQSTYVPDEYWQSLEVAHKKVFGYGYQTWEWGKGIRSYFYVSIIYVLYSVLKFFQLDSPELIIILPRVLQGLLSALGDVYFIRWIHEKRSGQFYWGLLSWVTTFFISYCSTRTLINTFEMNLTIIALYYYPWTPKSSSISFVAILSFLCFVRPTAAIVWIPLVLFNFYSSKDRISLLLSNYIPVGVVVVALNVALDSYFHKGFIFTPYNFFKANIVEGVSTFYGSHDFLWYIYAGFPTVIGLQVVPFYLRSLLKITRPNFFRTLKYDLEAQMIFTILWALTVLSIIPHKEFRFLLPLAPMAVFVSSGALGKWSSNAKQWMLYVVGVVLIASNTGALIYLGRYHTVGPLATMSVLRNDISNTSAKILFLAPCHSFPLYSHLHSNVSTRFLTCTPNFKNETEYKDETDVFYENPMKWLRSQYATLRPCTLPTHIVKYDTLNITNFLHINNYTLNTEIFNSFYYPQNTGKFIHIYKRNGIVC